MATQTISLVAEFEEFATPLVQSGRYSDPKEVLHAAMRALRRETLTEAEEDKMLEAFAEEGDASGDAEGDVIGRICETLGLKRPESI